MNEQTDGRTDGRTDEEKNSVTPLLNPFPMANTLSIDASFRNCINCVHCDDHFFIFIFIFTLSIVISSDQ